MVSTPDALQAISFRKHQGNSHHKASVKKYLCGISEAVSIDAAPEADCFEGLLTKIGTGQPTLSTRKEAQMTWRLAAALGFGQRKEKWPRQACKERSFSLPQPRLGNVLEPPKEQAKQKADC